MREECYGNKVPLPPRRHREGTSLSSSQLKVPSNSYRSAVPLIPRTNPRNRAQLDFVKSEKNIGDGNGIRQEQPQNTVEYLDPVQNFDEASSELSSPVGTDTTSVSCKLGNGKVEYALVNEEGTQAVINANLMQDMLRTNNSVMESVIKSVKSESE
uniref:Uncharacterized protein n=1 Tax=Syphacia muris TaxID=451379 RepID=A0A0N5ACP1_9BILA